MSEQPIDAQTAFFVVVDADGVISVHTKEIPAVNLRREANLYDIETYGSQLVRNVGRVIQTQMLVASVSPVAEPSASERVEEALKRRAGE